MGGGHAHEEHEHGDENGHGHSHDGGSDYEQGHNGEGHGREHGGDHEHDGDISTTSVLADHLRDDAYALISKTAEAAAAVLFAALLVLNR